MVKKIFFSLLLFFFFLFFFNFFLFAQENEGSQNIKNLEFIPRAYQCPSELDQIYSQKNNGEKCTTNYQEFKSDPFRYHFWTDDEKVTVEGRAKERARQFIFWVMNHPSIDNHPVLIKIWLSTRNLSYFFTILIAALLGLMIIISQKTTFDTGVKIWPSLIKILLSLFYITFSATIVISLIQLSDILMKFFIENLGGKDLFNTYFKGISQESNYDFFGIKDLNIAAQESVRNQLFLLKLTEITYYILGGVFILRKIVLWFLLFVSPFLSILLSFSFLKNTGIIWIRVFFQWLFYGPLMALFLGALSTIWKNGIPFVFDFSRSEKVIGYVYPTATNILWGGPSQKLSILNNINYIDPYAEYIITLIMLWIVIFFPWWLLRTFRDYCCDGINAIKNILMSNISSFHTPPFSPSSLIAPSKTVSVSTVKEVKTEQIKKIETIEEIKKAKTEEIINSLNIKASNLTEVAKIETNKEMMKNINYLKNPTQASTITERQKYINIRIELSNRASQNDKIAQRVITSMFLPSHQQIKDKLAIINTLPKLSTTTQVISYKVKLPQPKVSQISSTTSNYLNLNPLIITKISQKTKIEEDLIKKTLNILNQMLDKSPMEILDKINEETKLEKEKISLIIKEYYLFVKSDDNTIKQIAESLNVKPEEVKKVVETQTNFVTEPEKNIEEIIQIPQTINIDEYEQIKKMWENQYEKGEVPINENIKSRNQWVENEIVFITNTLNKLYSSDNQIKQQGLDEIGYILPIFMINNLTGEQLVVYLKAKLEAAKTVKMLLDKEKEIREKLREESDKVEVLKPKKKEAEKTMEIKEEVNE